MLKYHPYKSDKPNIKYYNIANGNITVIIIKYFDAAGYSDFTIHKCRKKTKTY